MKDKNANWQEIIDQIPERLKSFLSWEKVEQVEKSLVQVQQQVVSLQTQLEGVNTNLRSQIAEAVQQQLTQMSSSRIDSLENSIAQLQQQVASLQQQLESTAANIQNQIEEAVQKRLTQMSSSKIGSLEQAFAQQQQQVTQLQQQLQSVVANIPNQIEEAVQKRLLQLNQPAPILLSPQLQLNKTIFAPGEEIQVSFVASSSFASNAWVGIIPSHIPHGSETINDQHDLSFHYLHGQISGNLVFKAPNQEGSYDLRMNNSGNEVTSTSLRVAVDLSGVQLQLNKTTFAPCEEIQVSFVASPNFASNAWVGIIPSDIPHGSVVVNDQHDLSYQDLRGRTSGVLVFTAPRQEGSYDFRMNSSGQEVASTSFSVVVDLSRVQLLLNETTFAPGEEIQVSFVASPSFASNAWIGIIPSNIPHGSEAVNDSHDLSYQYLSERTSGTLIFRAPTQIGSYDLRMHDTDSNGREVYSVSFEVRQN